MPDLAALTDEEWERPGGSWFVSLPLRAAGFALMYLAWFRLPFLVATHEPTGRRYGGPLYETFGELTGPYVVGMFAPPPGSGLRGLLVELSLPMLPTILFFVLVGATAFVFVFLLAAAVLITVFGGDPEWVYAVTGLPLAVLVASTYVPLVGPGLYPTPGLGALAYLLAIGAFLLAERTRPRDGSPIHPILIRVVFNRATITVFAGDAETLERRYGKFRRAFFTSLVVFVPMHFLKVILPAHPIVVVPYWAVVAVANVSFWIGAYFLVRLKFSTGAEKATSS